MSTSEILLVPRPFAVYSGRLLLLPLLPKRRPLRPLPSEIWSHVFEFILGVDTAARNGLLTVCKSFTDIVLPVFYSRVRIRTLSSLEKFVRHLRSSDEKWDSIRRIPYSTPGRWVQTLDVSGIPFTSQPEAFLLDSLLTQLFPLVPFLTGLSLNPSFVLSRRALASLTDREQNGYLRVLEGVGYVPATGAAVEDDFLVNLLRSCVNLETLEVIGPGLDPSEFEFSLEGSETMPQSQTFRPLSLPHLRNMTLLSMHSSPLMLALLYSTLPSLRKLVVTPFDDIPAPASLVSEFVNIHGHNLRSLLLFTPKTWPTRLHPSPQIILHACPNLRHLSLENPLPRLQLDAVHPLQILSIPRPTPEFWTVLEGLLPRLPALKVVRARDVRWLRKGMTLHAQGAGVQGELREWRRRLLRRGIRVMDADWRESE
ncbi:hypothetical protein PLICRDRAFT_153229 [Plicaturopsis crispa FD-325 SS-3]|nr:hypothetical protein PLICRDRAFT_153229 [Plicaturopsis crispa FD-325 SS-3]